MPSFFVYARLDSAEQEAFLAELFRCFNGRPPTGGIHVTIRGPYARKPALATMSRIQRDLNLEPLLFTGVRVFQGARRVVVLPAINDRLQRVWWKPDFPTRIHGFTPHVTMYDGPSEESSRAVESFIKSSRIELKSSISGVSVHETGSPDLFPSFHERLPNDLVLDKRLAAIIANARRLELK